MFYIFCSFWFRTQQLTVNRKKDLFFLSSTFSSLLSPRELFFFSFFQYTYYFHALILRF